MCVKDEVLSNIKKPNFREPELDLDVGILDSKRRANDILIITSLSSHLLATGEKSFLDLCVLVKIRKTHGRRK